MTDIRVVGLRYTREYVVTRELASKVGEPYRLENLAEDERRLDHLRIFSSIDVDPLVTDNGVEIEVRVKETFPYIPTISLQVSDENGVAAGPGVKSVNFLGRAVELGLTTQFGGATNIDFYLNAPWVVGTPLPYEIGYTRSQRENVLDNFDEVFHDAPIRAGTVIGKKGRVGGTARVLRVSSDVDGITLSPSNRDSIVAFGAFIGYDSRDIWTRPQNGWWNEVAISRSDVVGQPANYWTSIFDVRRFNTFDDRHTVLATALWTLQSGELGRDIPIHQDFHIGGANTIRGWSLDSRSGKNQAINTFEYRYMLLEPRDFSVRFFTAYVGLQLAGFADLGHAWTESREFAIDQFIGGYGIGLRILLPFIDEMRMDVAWGEPGQGPTFHFGVFPKVLVQRNRVR